MNLKFYEFLLENNLDIKDVNDFNYSSILSEDKSLEILSNKNKIIEKIREANKSINAKIQPKQNKKIKFLNTNKVTTNPEELFKQFPDL